MIKNKNNKKIIRNLLIVFAILCTGIVYSYGYEKRHTVTLKAVESDVTMESVMSETVSVESNSVADTHIYVYVCGQVRSPGVYEASEKSRVYQLIEQAGGTMESANLNSLNMAEEVVDGQKIYVPSIEEAVQDSAVQDSVSTGSSLINLNKATKEQLMTLPGIGESKADDILAYRKDNGSFKKIEDVMNISGIKEAAFNKIKTFITV